MSGLTNKTPGELLNTPVQFLKGVGPDRAELLAKLRLRKASDLLFFFPRDYQDMSALLPIRELREDELATVCGTVEEVDLRQTGPGKCIVGVLIRDETDFLRAVWFNQPFMRQKFRQKQRVMLAGTAKRAGLRWEMAHPKVEYLDDAQPPPTGRILPVYSLTQGINQYQMRQIVQNVVETCTEAVDEVFPEELLDRLNLWPIRAALPQIHNPSDAAALEEARRRFVYQELLVLQLALALRKRSLTVDAQSPELPTSPRIDARIVRLFPFDLTTGQRRAIDEVASDMARPHPMNRLLQGDVGSGKTVVAVYAMLLAVAHGHQAALMAPTEVLARQHFRTLSISLAESKVRMALLVGSLSASERRKTLEEIAAGDVDLIVGTQAIIQDKVQFAKLGLVVIDEQHKFGVKQRATLKQAGLDPHYLVMTATPIPRTVSMTLFGDLDVSTLREPPPGRQPVHTYLGDDDRREKWWDFFRKKLREGRQGYVITPLVDESDALEVANVEAAFEHLANGELADFQIGLVHGRMDAAAKDAAMQAFEAGQTQVLVATSVVEVGVDVPNATVMTIESGQRFGLAQLHQLRGRVSRGRHPGFVCVFSDATSRDARQRLEALAASSDGFELAEIDFRLRGPGDLLGTRQHGLPPLRIADLQRDTELLESARRDAQQLVAEGAFQHDEAYSRLRKMVLSRYGKALALGDVG